jgi:A/G-specific adenine glycosylase
VPASETLDREAFRLAILGWYRVDGRVLGFRSRSDPYAVLVSETMAQQTQIGRVSEHWEQFLAAFPSFEALAAAPTPDVLRAWRGLGYNRRAVNLQRCARIVVERFGGRLPEDLATLESLPGIGRYTARAVAAIAYNAPVGPVDVNVARVLGRAAGDVEAAGETATRARDIQDLADALAAATPAGEWTHALMDVGATFCRPMGPRCDQCPARVVRRFAARTADGTMPVPSAAPSSTRQGSGALGFTRTRRWLRGRIVDRLRDAPDGGWTIFDDPIGSHDVAAVRDALLGLEREGLIELRAVDRPALEARLPTG